MRKPYMRFGPNLTLFFFAMQFYRPSEEAKS